MTDIEVLPLPEADGFMETFDTYGCSVGDENAWGEETVKETIRANIAHATEPLKAEIERLKVVAHGFVDEIAAKDAEIETLRNQRDFLVAEYERAVDCGEQGYTHAAMHLFNAIANAQADENAKTIMALRAEVVQVREAYENRTRDYYAQGDAYDILRARAERLEASLQLARDLVEDWAGYAGEYFQKKHNLEGDLALLDAALHDHEQEMSNE